MGGSSAVGSMDFEEAVAIEQRAHAADRERQERIDSKKRRLGLPIPGEVMTREEREKRLWAFMYVLFLSTQEKQSSHHQKPQTY